VFTSEAGTASDAKEYADEVDKEDGVTNKDPQVIGERFEAATAGVDGYGADEKDTDPEAIFETADSVDNESKEGDEDDADT
jgi:hypothetical protein